MIAVIRGSKSFRQVLISEVGIGSKIQLLAGIDNISVLISFSETKSKFRKGVPWKVSNVGAEGD